MGFGGMSGVIVLAGETGSALDSIVVKADAAAVALTKVEKAAAAVLQQGQWMSGPGGTSATGGYQGAAWGESLTPDQKIALGFGVTPGADSAAVAASFKALADRIDKFEGNTNNYWSQLLTKEIPYLTTGATSAASAEGMISTILKVFLPGMEKELQDPKTPKEMQSIIRELLQFAQSGVLQTDKISSDLEKWLSAHGG